MGEVDIDKEDEPLDSLTQIPFEQAQQISKEKNEERIAKEKLKNKKFKKLGLISDFSKTDLY